MDFFLSWRFSQFRRHRTLNQIDVRYITYLYSSYMEIHQLRALETIVKEGSFVAAAARLDLSQSSLSHAIAALELELGVRLLDRGRHGARPTEAGRRILKHGSQILASVEAILAETDSSVGILSGRVRVGSIPSATVAFLPKVIARFARAHPEVEIVLLEEPSQSTQLLEEWLRTQTIDVALIQLPAVDTKTVVLLRDELCAILPAASPLSRRRQVSIRDLATEPFIMSRYTSELLLQAAYARHHLTPCVRFEVQDRETLVSMVREGLGFSIVPLLAFPASLPGVTLVPITPHIYRELGLAVRDTEPTFNTLRAFVRSAQEVAIHKRKRS
jgi:DNA-binding transcriptional LysR family regulator